MRAISAQPVVQPINIGKIYQDAYNDSFARNYQVEKDKYLRSQAEFEKQLALEKVDMGYKELELQGAVAKAQITKYGVETEKAKQDLQFDADMHKRFLELAHPSTQGELAREAADFKFTTFTSKGDEMTDSNTANGISATGKNLAPGVIAGGGRGQLGDVMEDTTSGRRMLVAEVHGNKDPNVFDMYKDPSEYKRESGVMSLRKIGKIPVSQVPKTVEGMNSFISAINSKDTTQIGDNDWLNRMSSKKGTTID